MSAARVAFLGKVQARRDEEQRSRVRTVIAFEAEHRLDKFLEIAGLARATLFYHPAASRLPTGQIIFCSIGSPPNPEVTNAARGPPPASSKVSSRSCVPTRVSSISTPRGALGWTAPAAQSMACKGNCHDNTVMENFCGHLEEELFDHVRFLSTDALAAQLNEYNRVQHGTDLNKA